jgi:hypothetical protein
MGTKQFLWIIDGNVIRTKKIKIDGLLMGTS